jgi:hypothetical protein
LATPSATKWEAALGLEWAMQSATESGKASARAWENLLAKALVTVLEKA